MKTRRKEEMYSGQYRLQAVAEGQVKDYVQHEDIGDEVLRGKIRRKEFTFGGNKALKIYGRLQCNSGKRMKKENRIFFVSETDAVVLGYRPCGHCMRQEYRQWKHRHGSV